MTAGRPPAPPLAKRLRRAGMGLATVLGFARRGFFTPYRYAAAVPEVVAPYAEIDALFAGHEADFATVLAAVQAYAADLRAIEGAAPEPRWRQDWFPRLDGAAAYALARRHRPARIVEVGSGHSTRFLARAARDGGFPCRHIAIDPAPRASLAGLPVEWIAATLALDHLALFDTLAEGDIAFFDSSHILWPGSDVDIILARILPRLRRGVLVHIHDILLPDPYPAEWAWRGYTEQSGVAALLAGGAFAPVFASHYGLSRMGALETAPVLAELPLAGGARETSLWLRRV